MHFSNGVDFRSSAGYTPLDFAFVVKDNKGLIEKLDSDRQLLPRRDDDPKLEEKLLEVWKYNEPPIALTKSIIFPLSICATYHLLDKEEGSLYLDLNIIYLCC